MDKNEMLLNILKEHMLYQRHQETQRMWTANIFIAVVVGTLVYSINTGFENIPWFIPLAFLIISTICLLITSKLNTVFSRTQNTMENTFKDISHFKKSKDKDWNNYMWGRKSPGGLWSALRIRYLYLALYTLAIIGSLAWLFVLNKWAFAIATVITVIIFAVVIPAAISERRKEKEEQEKTGKEVNVAIGKSGVEQPTEEDRKAHAKILRCSKAAFWIAIAGLVVAIAAIIVAISY